MGILQVTMHFVSVHFKVIEFKSKPLRCSWIQLRIKRHTYKSSEEILPSVGHTKDVKNGSGCCLQPQNITGRPGVSIM